jgi:heat shock protein HslJ
MITFGRFGRSQHVTWTAAVLVGAAMLLVACGSDDSSGGESSGSPPDVAGKEYVSTDVEGHDLVPDTTIRITFQDETLSANAGCNTMNGGYSFDGDTLQVEALAATQMACLGPVMDQDTFLSDLLTSGPTVTRDGDQLTLTSGDVTVTMLDREVAEPDLPLQGTTWTLEWTTTNDANATVPLGVESSLLIENGQATIDTGCNTGTGSVEISDTTLTFGPIATTLMMCEGDAGETETTVLTMLDGEVDYLIEADHLTIRRPDGTGLDYRAQQ